MLFFILQNMTKQQLRAHYLEKRKALSEEEIDDASMAIANNLLALNIWNKSFYHLFLSIEKHKEVDTHHVLNILMGKDKNIVISRSNFKDLSMSHYLLTDQTKLELSKYGIPEPSINSINIDESQIEIVFVPLIITNVNGQRIGYGKGFYDRFLARCRPDVLKIGLSVFEPLDMEFEKDSFDVALDLIITPSNSYYIT